MHATQDPDTSILDPHLDAIVRDLVETREGAYWVATMGGVCRFTPASRSGGRFALLPRAENAKAGNGYALFEDHTGAVWFGTGRGLMRLEQQRGEWALLPIDLHMPSANETDQ